MKWFDYIFGPWKAKSSLDGIPGIEPSYYPPPPKKNPLPNPVPRAVPFDEVFRGAQSVSVPRPEWFRIDQGENPGTVVVRVTMTKGEIAAASIELASIGHRPALAGFKNALQIAAKVLDRIK